MHIFWGLVIMAAGAFMVMKTEWLLQNFGRLAWFEAKLGTEGGSRLGYKLIGLIIIIIGIIQMSGGMGGFLTWALGPILKYNK
ncbi:MAG: hypothetical protein NTX66_03520 [Candidatus Falkowbacteria bacterium]|nr:hypothetical protein [Candidatus Falkowbacteria bacterium]